LVDVHISPIIAKWIKEDFGYEIKSSFILQLKNLDDLEIYYKAKEAGYVIIISKDSDLPAIIDRLGSPPKVTILQLVMLVTVYFIFNQEQY
jgi:predicted nuclease of predicted toxin-antitoxin system